MPMSASFKNRLWPVLDAIAEHFETPFHIYDQEGITTTGRDLQKAFADLQGFREYFAVKALPNPRILEMMRDLGFGFDCSSIPELIQARQIGAQGDDIMFTSNNTSPEEFRTAADGQGSILNLDDISLIAKVPVMPTRVCFRYNPGPRRSGNSIIGNPVESKYGVSHEQLPAAYRAARERGATRFGLHTMMASNDLDSTYMVQTADMLLAQVERLARDPGIRVEFINIGGGQGIPYKPDDPPYNLEAMARDIIARLRAFRERNGYAPRLYMESGRYMTGPHGALVVRAINRKEIYRTYIGVDASMSALMRPAMYGAYHHISVPGKTAAADDAPVDVVGSLCENNDKFAVQRRLPPIVDGDLLVVHDTGAHGHSMGFNYNGRLRPKELLLCPDGSVQLIRRAETMADYTATLTFAPDVLQL